MTIDEDKLKEISKSLSSGSKPKAPRKTAQPAVKIKGDHNIVGDGNVIHIYKRTTQKAKPVVKTGDGVISAAQKSVLKSLVDDIASLTGDSHGAIWTKFNRSMHVNSYHEIPTEQFKAAEAKLMQWRASARKSSTSPAGKKGMIAAVQTRWKQDGTEAQGRAFMLATYGQASLTDLSIEQLRGVYNLAFKAR